MRRGVRMGLLGALVLLVAALILPGAGASAGPACQFVLGFRALYEQISDVTGLCVTDEYVDPLTGDTVQPTTGWMNQGGLFVWRKGDNHLAYTDGGQTWILRNGVVVRPRPNTDRYPWESERISPRMLMNAEYRLPVSLYGSGDVDGPIRLTAGKAELPERGVVGLLSTSIWYGDLNGDGYRDAVAVIGINYGGSGTFVFAVPVLDVNGQPRQLGYELLGDRVWVNAIGMRPGVFTVEMTTQGPGEPMCCGTLRVTNSYPLKQSGIPQVPAPTPGAAGIPNPASANCVAKGGKVETVKSPTGEAGVCVLPDGTRCDEWAFYRGECPSPRSTPTPTPGTTR